MVFGFILTPIEINTNSLLIENISSSIPSAFMLCYTQDDANAEGM